MCFITFFSMLPNHHRPNAIKIQPNTLKILAAPNAKIAIPPKNKANIWKSCLIKDKYSKSHTNAIVPRIVSRLDTPWPSGNKSTPARTKLTSTAPAK